MSKYFRKKISTLLHALIDSLISQPAGMGNGKRNPPCLAAGFGPYSHEDAGKNFQFLAQAQKSYAAHSIRSQPVYMTRSG